MDDPTAPIQKERKRPFGLYIIIGLQFIIAISLASGFLILDLLDPPFQDQVWPPGVFNTFGWLIVGIFLLAIVGLLRLKRWGWTLTMILTGTGLALNIWLYFQGAANYLDMASHIVIVFYLNQRDVQAPFLSRKSPGGVL
jgi:hypothetical protein